MKVKSVFLDFGACIIVFLMTLIAIDQYQKFEKSRSEKQMTVCIEYFDESGHKIKECEFQETKSKDKR